MVWDLPIPVIATAVGSFFGFITALAGFWLNARLTWKRQQEATALQVANVRTLIACEIDHNLQSLRTYLDGLNRLGKREQAVDGVLSVTLVTPQYSQDAFRSQMSVLPLALEPKEIQDVFRFYSDLGRLVKDSHPPYEIAFETEGGTGITEAKRQLWTEFKRFASDRLIQGNPLRQKPELLGVSLRQAGTADRIKRL